MKPSPVLPALPRGLDLFSKRGAYVLAKFIESHWAARGHTVVCERYDIFGDESAFGVRSDLVNGLPAPKKYVPAAVGVFKL